MLVAQFFLLFSLGFIYYSALLGSMTGPFLYIFYTVYVNKYPSILMIPNHMTAVPVSTHITTVPNSVSIVELESLISMTPLIVQYL